MLPVLHNFNAIKGEIISLNIGYNNVVASENLFACVRKYRTDEDYKAKFDISVSTDDLENKALQVKMALTVLKATLALKVNLELLGSVEQTAKEDYKDHQGRKVILVLWVHRVRKVNAVTMAYLVKMANLVR